MKFSRRFYDSSINLKNISVKRIVLAITLGLASAFIIYSFFYVIRETFRVISFGLMNYGFQNSQNILSETDRNFYNIFFAGLSVIAGNSIAILYIFSKPNKIFSRFNSKRKRILNDQIFLNFNFLYWFNKIGLSFGVFALCCMDFAFIPYFKPFAHLLLIVLYLESWKNLSFVFKKNRFKFQFLHLLLILTLIFGLSRVNIINYKAIDELSLKYNPLVNLPRSDFYEKKNWNYPEVTFKLKLNKNNTLEIFTEDKTKINIKEVHKYMMSENSSIREELIPFLKVRVLADKEINIKYIKMLEAELYIANYFNIIYEIYNDDLKKSKLENGEIRKRINKSVLEFRENINSTNKIPLPPKPPLLINVEEYNFKDTLSITIENNIKINNLIYSKKMLVKEFKNYIDKDILIIYNLNSKTIYQDYIDVLSCHFIAANELRRKEQTIFKNFEYDNKEEYRNEQFKLKRKYPVIILEKLRK